MFTISVQNIWYNCLISYYDLLLCIRQMLKIWLIQWYNGRNILSKKYSQPNNHDKCTFNELWIELWYDIIKESRNLLVAVYDEV